MPANTVPIFTLTPRIQSARISTANTARDGTGSLSSVITGATDGTRIDRIVICATVTTTAGMVRLFIDDGTNVRLWREVPVTAITVGASTAAFTSTISSPDSLPLLVLPLNYILKAGTHNAEQIDVIVHAANF
jgi:hypothetical protein